MHRLKMKKIIILALLMVSTIALAACGTPETTTTTYTPEIQGLAETLSLRVGDDFDPYNNVFAFDPLDGNISDSIYIEGLSEFPISSNNTITESGTYVLTYTIINSGGIKVSKPITITITSFFEELADYEIGTYELVFSDEFNYTGLPDSDKWNFQTGGTGFGNNELQYYTDRLDNAFVEDGHLTLRLIKEVYSGNDWTSAKIWTRDIESWTYAKIEVRAQLPAGLGTWPAIWMMPQDSVYGGWPRSGEIDNMEHVGYNENVVHGTIHTELYNGQDGTQRGGSVGVPTATTEWHTYTTEWLPDKIIWSVDGEVFFTYRFAIDSFNTLEESQYWQMWPYDQDFYLILNFAFGGNWGGAQGIDDTLTNVDFLIDYVRVYQGTGLTEE